MGLMQIIQCREFVARLCAAIDAGQASPTEEEMLEIAVLVDQNAGPLRHDLLVMLASRTVNGRAALKDIAQ